MGGVGIFELLIIAAILCVLVGIPIVVIVLVALSTSRANRREREYDQQNIYMKETDPDEGAGQ